MSSRSDLPRSRAPETRAVWWLLGGIGLVAVVIVLMAPELLGDLRGLGSLALVVIAAGIPGLAIVLVVASRRRAERAREHRGDAADEVERPGPDDPGAR